MGLEQHQALLNQSMIFPVGVILSAYPVSGEATTGGSILQISYPIQQGRFPALLIHGMNQLFSQVTKGFSGFLVKTVVSASGSLRLSGLSHGTFYFYYRLKLSRAGALAILTGSLPPVCHMLH